MTVIANLVNAHKSYNIVTLDFQRVFNNVPHHLLLKAPKGQQLHKMSLKWIASFLSGRTQQVIVNGTVLSSSAVTSGVVQGSVFGPKLFAIFIDSSLQQLDQLTLKSSFAFANDFKFVVETSKQGFGLAQRAVNVIGYRSITHLMPLSVDKILVLLCGPTNPKRYYVIYNQPLPTARQIKDLGILRSQARPLCRASNKLVSELPSSIGYYS